MKDISLSLPSLSIKYDLGKSKLRRFLERYGLVLVVYILTIISTLSYIYYYQNGLGLAYNDARSHLDISRRVVEGLKPGIAQLGSVWLPLPHALMVLTVWNDFLWHSGLSGALISMISFVITGVLIYKFLQQIGVGVLGRLVGVFIFVSNLNILYLQSTAMTECLLLATMTAGIYELLLWFKKDSLFNLIQAAFWVMLSTLVRYDGWFLLIFSAALISYYVFSNKGKVAKASFKKRYKSAEGVFILFWTLAGFGVFLWLLWNQLIFKDAFYFAFGPFSAHAQQTQLEKAGELVTKGNWFQSIKFYTYAVLYNSNAFMALLGVMGTVLFYLDRKKDKLIKLASLTLFAPLLFNIIALFMGHSVLYIQGLSGNTWFNVRYGIMMLPTIAIFTGYLVYRLVSLRVVLIGLILLTTFFSFSSADAVTIEDAKFGSSQKNVTEVSGWLNHNTKDKEGFVLISAASHDAIIFSSGLPMKKFIHEGTGRYWEEATTSPEHWARWIIMRTHDENDLTFKAVNKTPYLEYYNLVGTYPFADIYQIKDEYVPQLITKPILGKQK